MPERDRPPQPWFHKITPEVLAAAGPRRMDLKGADISAGQPSAPPGDKLTQDVYEQAEQSRRR